MMYNFRPKNALAAMAKEDINILTVGLNNIDSPVDCLLIKYLMSVYEQNKIPRTPLGMSRACPSGTMPKKDSIFPSGSENTALIEMEFDITNEEMEKINGQLYARLNHTKTLRVH